MLIDYRSILKALALLCLLSSATAAASIGKIDQVKGNGEVVRRASKVPAQLNTGIEKMDNVQTGNGRLEIKFVDNSVVKITEHSKLVIDDFVYSGNPSTSKMALKFASGTVRFATGTGIKKSNINLRTPSAAIAVRGTDFTSTVDEFGKSLIVLLPEEDGTVGEIIVSNAAGSVTLTRAFQATMVLTTDSRPSKPVILRLDLNTIDNMLIVAPPSEFRKNEDSVTTKSNLLDLSELDIDYLKNTDLEKNNLNTSSLDILSIDANFLEDYLSGAMGFSDTKDGVSITGTTFGHNPSTQIYTIIEQDKVRFSRNVGTTVDISVPKDQGKNISIDTNNKVFNIQVNEGGTKINVKQSN
jgi:hypothetical protein